MEGWRAIKLPNHLGRERRETKLAGSLRSSVERIGVDLDSARPPVQASVRDSMISDRRFVVALLVGVSTLAGLSVLQAQKTAINPTPPPTLRVEYIPNPNDIVNLREGTSYTVPTGMILIITDWAVTQPNFPAPPQNAEAESDVHARVLIDSLEVWGGGFAASIIHKSELHGLENALGMASSGGGHLSGSLRSGIRAEAGQIVEIDAVASYGGPMMYASGYLYPAQ
ncbi:MAG: hypothetical protein DWQ01_08710 [Planctomycetota bacterium]|nr:MAG: hypothetical protein DWQ01_08710 [Planctomycetota bacterium]